MHFFWSQHVATMDWCTYPVTQHLTSRFLWDTAVILQLRPQTTIGVTSTPRTPRRHLSWAVTGKHVGQFLWSKANQPYSMLFNPRLCNGVYICFHMFPQYEPRSERAFRTMQAKMVEQWEHFQAHRSALVHPRCCRGCRYSLNTARRDLTSDEMIWTAFNIT